MKILHQEKLIPRIAVVVGTRPGIIKMAPLVRELATRGINHFIIHTGQHYSPEMDQVFFEELGLPFTQHHLKNVRNCYYHGAQTAEMIRGVEEILLAERPKIVLVCGDANTNLAAGLAARKLRMIVGHVESGLRSHDWSMPEEHNRIILDHICELLFAPTKNCCRNLIMDNVRGEIHLVGNTIVDSTFQNIKIAERNNNILENYGISEKKFIMFTSHREENVDVKYRFKNILKGVEGVGSKTGMPVIFPAHPRTRKRLKEFGMLEKVLSSKHIKLIKPVGYLTFLLLIKHAAVILTDSGGIQEESCILHAPCVTLRDNTERPETLSVGSNIIAGTDPDNIYKASMKMLTVERKWDIPFGDGFASVRIVDVVESVLKKRVDLIDISRKLRYEMGETFSMKGVNVI